MAERILLPLEDESEDIVMRLSRDEASALYSLLSKLSPDELVGKGLTREQAGMIGRITHVTY
ncbi:hypothetical protein [Pseudomonas sp. CCI2.4]|uniref:hypothetical protein n=1 Tax=Pseudomonas sp. CCI2.4 TaxID=3048617 RepID=UPI002B22AE2C|nr:hypothetical protein [Pseudomonas sp. CCI2.4]MEB0133559.1 hypothetical protein [Pseudomonas sp. CCI2.4]